MAKAKPAAKKKAPAPKKKAKKAAPKARGSRSVILILQKEIKTLRRDQDEADYAQAVWENLAEKATTLLGARTRIRGSEEDLKLWRLCKAMAKLQNAEPRAATPYLNGDCDSEFLEGLELAPPCEDCHVEEVPEYDPKAVNAPPGHYSQEETAKSFQESMGPKTFKAKVELQDAKSFEEVLGDPQSVAAVAAQDPALRAALERADRSEDEKKPEPESGPCFSCETQVGADQFCFGCRKHVCNDCSRNMNLPMGVGGHEPDAHLTDPDADELEEVGA